MTKRWYIYRDGRALGPYEAREIRESLREGMWDPFDLVSAEGSAVKIPLVEVDEIFASSQIDLEAAPRSLVEPLPDEFQHAPLEVHSKMEDIPLAGSDQPRPSAGEMVPYQAQKQPAAAARQPRRAKRKRDPKRFFLRDAKGRLLGPQSAGEIQSLFYKGVLDKSVKVLKEGSTQAVPVAKFVTVYSESRRKKAMQGAHPTIVGGMSTSRLHEMALAKNAQSAAKLDYRPFLAVGVFVFGLSIALLALWLILGPDGNLSSKSNRPVKVEPKPAPVNPSGKLRRPKEFKVKTVERDDSARKAAPLKKAPPRKKAPVVKAPPRAKAPVTKTSVPVRTSVRKAPPPKTIYQPPPQPRATPKPAPKTYPQQAAYKPDPGPRVNQLAAGQQVKNFGPSRYNVSTVQSCSGACSITFVGPGGVFVGKFFGDAYKNALVKKGGTAYISGTVTRQGSQVSIIINGVN